MAQAAWAELSPHVSGSPTVLGSDDPYDATYNPGGNLITTGSFRTTTGGGVTNVSGTAPNGWNVSRPSGKTASEVVVSTVVGGAVNGGPGNALQLACALASGQTTTETVTVQGPNVSSANYAAGDQVYLEAEVQVSGITGGYLGAQLRLVDYNGANTYTDDGIPQNGYGVTSADHAITLRTPVRTLPSGVTNLNPYVLIVFDASSAAAAATIKISGVQMRKAGV
jgi:hypothetical protein